MLDLESLKAEFPKFQEWQDVSTEDLFDFQATLKGNQIRGFLLRIFCHKASKYKYWHASIQRSVSDGWQFIVLGIGDTPQEAIATLKSQAREVSKALDV